MSSTLTPNMSLVVPGVGTESGPQYANDINGDLTILDGHNHSSGSGVQITPSGLNINAQLPINNNILLDVGSVNLEAQSVAPSLNSSLYSEGVDLYYVDGSGNQIRITESGNVAGTPGSISGLVPPASASYSGGTFVFESAALTAANLDAASIILRNTTASSFGLTLSPPNSLGSNYSIVLPVLPSQSSFVQLDTSGNLTASVAVVGGISGGSGGNIATNSVSHSNFYYPGQSASSASQDGLLATNSSGTFDSSGPVTNLSGVITTSGRPILAGIVPDGSNNPMLIGANTNPCVISILNGSNTIVASWQLTVGIDQGMSLMTVLPNAAGNLTFSVSVTTGSAQVNYAKLILIEL